MGKQRAMPKKFLGGLLAGAGSKILGGIGGLASGDKGFGEFLTDDLLGAIPLLGGLIGQGKANRANEDALAEQAASQQRIVDANNLKNDTRALQVFPTKGVASAPFGLADGGPAPANFQALHGGSLRSLGSGVFLAKGRSHAAGGIKGDTNFDGQADVEIENNELFFDSIGDNGFVVNKDISRKFIPQFRKLKGNTKLDRDTRKILIERAIGENEDRRERVENERNTSAEEFGSRASRGVRPTSAQARISGSNLFKRPKRTGTNRTVGTIVVDQDTDFKKDETRLRLSTEEAFGKRPRGRTKP